MRTSAARVACASSAVMADGSGNWGVFTYGYSKSQGTEHTFRIIIEPDGHVREAVELN
jgi:hypothetical protein